jgi:hypothetical protein
MKLAKSALKYVKPKLLILGGLSDNYLRYNEWMLGIRKIYEHPLYRPEKMQCKERLSRLLQTRLQEDLNFIWKEEKKELIEIDHNEQRVIPHSDLTAAQMASS